MPAPKKTAPATHHTCAVARPGDTLIIGLATPCEVDEVNDIAGKVIAAMPPGTNVCVVDNVSAIQVVRGDDR